MKKKQGTVLENDLRTSQGRKKVTLASMVKKGISEETALELSQEG